MTSSNSTLVIGGANLDTLATSSGAFVPADSNPGHITLVAGGVGRNIAENLARLGESTALSTLLGNDKAGQLVLASCHQVNIDTKAVITDNLGNTGSYLAICDNQGNLQAAVADMQLLDSFSPEHLASQQSALQNAKRIVVEANLPRATLSWIGEHCADKPICADAVSATKAPRLQSLLPVLHTLKVNRAEAAAILDTPTQQDPRILAAALREKGVKQVLLSLGDEGALLVNDKGEFSHPVLTVAMRGDNGAGDALLAGLIAAERLFDNNQNRLEFALACAAFTLQSPTAVNPKMSVDAVMTQFSNQLTSGISKP